MRIDLRLGTVKPIDPVDARRIWRAFRADQGWAPIAPLLTPPSANFKLGKDAGIASYGVSLAPHRISGTNVCPWSTPSCRANCVAFSGNGRYDSVTAARVLKNRFLLAHPEAFYSLVGFEIDKATVLHGSELRVRLNTFSDIAHENVAPWLLDNRPGVRFYDYTKGWDRNPPDNYRLTLSASERTTVDQIKAAVGNGRNVAVVFPQSRTTPLPETWQGLRVIDGDKTDNRADDPTGVVVGLRAKGSMRNERKGMVKKWESA